MTTLYLCGAGNSEGVRLALAINQEEARWGRIALLDDDPSKHGTSLLGVDIVGPFDLLEEVDPAEAEVANLVARTTSGRAKARKKILEFGVPFASLISPDVNSLGASLPEDIIVYQNATIGPEVSIGEGSVVFMGGVVGHESQLGPCCAVAANAVINARVTMGKGVYVGPNATVIYEVTIGPWATIGAGSAVIQDVPAGSTVVGVPGEVVNVGVEARQPAALDAPVSESGKVARGVAQAELERVIADVWSQVLGVSRVGATENFFDAGGTSLLALQARNRLKQTTLLELTNTDIYRYPTVQALAQYMCSQRDHRPARGPGQERGRVRRQMLRRRQVTSVHA